MVRTTSILVTILTLINAGICDGQKTDVVSGAAARQVLEEYLRTAQVSGSLAYWGQCAAQQPKPDLPSICRITDWSGSPVQTLGAMFADDPKMQVKQEANGTVRMIESGVPRDLLEEVRISHISFKDHDGEDGVWVPRQARRMIMQAPEVRDFMRAHNIGWASGGVEYINDISGGRAPYLPHVSGDLYDVTIPEAMDYVLKSFPGFWVYENCRNESGNRVVSFEIFGSMLRTDKKK